MPRISGVDIPPEKPIWISLTYIYGVGRTNSRVILREAGIDQFKILFIDGLNVGSYLRDTLLAEKVKTTEDAIMEIYRRLRPGDPPTLETAKQLFNNLFFNPERYDLSRVAR